MSEYISVEDLLEVELQRGLFKGKRNSYSYWYYFQKRK
jgi:hypothetical protein